MKNKRDRSAALRSSTTCIRGPKCPPGDGRSRRTVEVSGSRESEHDMGEGLKRVAKQCGGFIVKARGVTTRYYDANGKIADTKRAAVRSTDGLDVLKRRMDSWKQEWKLRVYEMTRHRDVIRRAKARWQDAKLEYEAAKTSDGKVSLRRKGIKYG